MLISIALLQIYTYFCGVVAFLATFLDLLLVQNMCNGVLSNARTNRVEIDKVTVVLLDNAFPWAVSCPLDVFWRLFVMLL